MSASAQIPEPPQPKPDRRRRREQARTVTWFVLTVLITVFAVLNFNDVKVKWIFGTSKAPLTIVIVVSLLVGIVLTYIADRRGGKRQGGPGKGP
jgi:uncharacterized integral membrane protein